jgi:hypothetical protein
MVVAVAQPRARVRYLQPWNTTSTLDAATNAQYFYDYAGQDPINNFDLTGTYKARAPYSDRTCPRGMTFVDLTCVIVPRGGPGYLSWLRWQMRHLNVNKRAELLQQWNGLFARGNIGAREVGVPLDQLLDPELWEPGGYLEKDLAYIVRRRRHSHGST